MNLSLFLPFYVLYPTYSTSLNIDRVCTFRVDRMCTVSVCTREREEYMATGQYKNIHIIEVIILSLSLSLSLV